MLTGDALDSAVAYNKGRGYTRAEIRRVQESVGAEPEDGYFGPDTTQAIAVWQGARGLGADGKLGADSWGKMIAEWWRALPWDGDAVEACTVGTIKAETGGAGFHAVNKDTEFRYSDYSYHVGLSFGIVQFAQDPGSLYRVFKRWSELDSADFRAHVVDDVELLDITRQQGPRELRIPGDTGRRRPCVMPVAGFDLWDDAGPWPERLDVAAKESEAFQRAQVEIMESDYLNPALVYAREYGWMSQADISVIFDICIQMGSSYIRKDLWPLVWRQRPSNARCLLDHLSVQHRERREKILDETAWWITYDI